MKNKRSKKFSSIQATDACVKSHENIFRGNRQCFRADGLSLLPSALRPCLFIIPLFIAGILSAFGCLCCWSTPNVSAASITLSLPTDALTLNLTPTGETKVTKSDASTFSVKTNAVWGYSLSIAAKNQEDAGNLVNGNAKIKSITSEMSEEDFESSGEINSWGFLPSKFNGVENTMLRSGPISSVQLDKTSSSNEQDNNYTVAIATKTDGSLAMGTYKSTFQLTATANSVSYTINYNLNQGKGGPEQNPQKDSTTEATVKISDKAPTRSGYEFKGWCPVETSDENCSQDAYQPGADVTLTGDNSNVTLWAMWKESLINFGNMSSFSCSRLSQIHSSGNVEYNGKLIKVTKLKDNKCWTVQDVASSVSYNAKNNYCYGPWRLPQDVDVYNLVKTYYPDYPKNIFNPPYKFNDSGDFSLLADIYGSSSSWTYGGTYTCYYGSTAKTCVPFYSISRTNVYNGGSLYDSSSTQSTTRNVRCVSN